jgi:dimethylhistidine N-methyltransferase
MADIIKNYVLYDYHPSSDNFKEDVLEGLNSCPRSIPPKYFYDQQGSVLFDQITHLHDYYPTRCELEIFETYAADIVSHIGADCVFIEPGAGNGDKARKLLKILNPLVYVPIDISRRHLINAAQKLAHDYPGIKISAVCSDFTGDLHLPDDLPKGNRVMFFPGSSIGNFHPDEAVEYLAKLATHVGENGQLLIGVDLKKDEKILQRAYDDSEGVTAKFNLNLLARMNNELSSDFDLNTWRHLALYNQVCSRIEMHLLSLCPQLVAIDDEEFYFEESDTIHTENSYKYSVDEFQSLADKAGFKTKKVWLDENKYFSVHLFVCD